MKSNKPLFPQLFKGIALFTPGGDLIYCLDPSKQGHWHIHLCVALQEILGLPEPPHFLVPGYTATIDRWLDPRTQQIRTSAEIYSLVRHYQALLNAVFGTPKLVWQMAPWHEGLCDPIVLETYRPQFPQLWEDHDLIMRLDRPEQLSYSYREGYPNLQRKEVSFANANREGSAFAEPSSYSSQTHTTSVNLTPSADASLPLTATLHVSVSDATPEELATRSESTSGSLRQQAARDSHQAPPPAERDALASEELPPELRPTNPGTSDAADAPSVANTYLSPSPTTVPSDAEEILPDTRSHHTQGYVLRLFVSGNSAATEYILMSLHQLLENSLRHPYTLKVIDIFKHPDQAEANQISATPTLLRVWPQPVRRIVGDLTDAERVLRILAAPEG